MIDLVTDRRDHVIARLSSGYAAGTFEVDELERRLALAHDARTPAELDALVTDLAPVSPSLALVPAQRTRVVFGAVERTGPWAVPSQLYVRVLWGHLLLDLRDAQLGPDGATIELAVTMGHVHVIVPPGLAVDVSASSFLASVDERIERAPSKGGPIVRVVGSVKLGNIEVETLRPGETTRDARRRRRRERRAHRRWRRQMRHALPPPWQW
jgi:hypothetical protein